jgi:transposase-like protein
VRLGPRWEDAARPKPYPREFRDDVVAVARKGGAPLKQIAKDFGISESCLANWMRAADVEDGRRPGATPTAHARPGQKTSGSPRAAGHHHPDAGPTARQQTPQQSLAHQPLKSLQTCGTRQSVHADSTYRRPLRSVQPFPPKSALSLENDLNAAT